MWPPEDYNVSVQNMFPIKNLPPSYGYRMYRVSLFDLAEQEQDVFHFWMDEERNIVRMYTGDDIDEGIFILQVLNMHIIIMILFM